ncbi:DNA primase [Motiliproteus sediminis]|uniref:DNA primase n=1 Tax=Motiliproteus sediminis TaxID=1468178 RepID=UPI001AEF58D8|nr:DNA primase [Motiliproteus sediminis]
MAGRIPQDFIDDLLNRTDIVDVVDERVQLKRTGRNYSGLCPFHKEKTPSFSVDPDKQFYYCFGCGAGGNALGFVMEYERIDFPQAVEMLARRQGLDIPQAANEHQQRERESALKGTYALLERADQFYRQQLRQHPERARAVDYLKNRGLSGQIAQQFGIGYAPPGWDNLLQHMGDDNKQRQQLDAAGLVILKPDEQKCYDRFRDRIMFPIIDMRGRVIAFGGRVLGDNKPKYLNSPETDVFHKNRELYGLYQARKANRSLERLVIVEGYMDVVALAQFGISNAVATLGTATSEHHLTRIFKLVPEVVFCFDGDQAGRQAARRALETALPQMQDGRQARFLFLPDGEDPDSMVRAEGSEAFNRRVGDAQPLSAFMFDTLATDIDLSSGEGRARLSSLAMPLIDRIPGKTLQQLMRQRLGELTGLDASFFSSTGTPAATSPDHHPSEPPLANYDDYDYGDYPPTAELHDSFGAPAYPQKERRPNHKWRQDKRNPYGNDLPRTPLLRPSSLAARALTRLLRHPKLAANVDFETSEALEQLNEPELSLLAALIDQARRQPNMPAALLVAKWRDTPHFDLLKQLAEREQLIPDPEQLRQEFLDCLQQLVKKREEARLDELKTRKPSQLSDQERQLLTKLLVSRARRR